MSQAGIWKLFCFLTEFFFVVGKQNIFGRGGKNVFSAQNWFEYWSSKFLVAWRLLPRRFASNDMLKHVESEAMPQKPLNHWGDAFGSLLQSAHGCFGRPKVWYGCSPILNLLAKWEYEIVSKRISELPFFSTYAFERTFENEQISSNVNFLVEFHWLGWNSTFLFFFEVTKPS